MRVNVLSSAGFAGLAAVLAVGWARANRQLGAAQHDAMTGVLRREHWSAVADRHLRRPSRRRAVVLFVDVDHFKQLNDLHGHAFGDRVLRTVADRIIRVVGSGVVGRWGGDEFVVLLNDADADVDERLRTAIGAPIPLRDGASLTVTATVGVAPVSETGLDAAVEDADAAMYDVKPARRCARSHDVPGSVRGVPGSGCAEHRLLPAAQPNREAATHPWGCGGLSGYTSGRDVRVAGSLLNSRRP